MADRGRRQSPSIQRARDVARQSGNTAVIMILINDDAGTVELATYGTTGSRCNAAAKLGDAAYDAVMDALEAEARVPMATALPQWPAMAEATR